MLNWIHAEPWGSSPHSYEVNFPFEYLPVYRSRRARIRLTTNNSTLAKPVSISLSPLRPARSPTWGCYIILAVAFFANQFSGTSQGQVGVFIGRKCKKNNT